VIKIESSQAHTGTTKEYSSTAIDQRLPSEHDRAETGTH
jgi:hypothetical protein